jgi:hypothetical protein
MTGAHVHGRAGRLSALITGWLLLSVPLTAQSPGTAAFAVFHRGTPVGTADVTLDRTEAGWRITSHSEIGGDFQLSVKQFDAEYDLAWQPRFMTMELSTPDEHAIVHVAMMGTTTRTDIVRPRKEALFGANDVATDTLFLPDYVFGAFEALAARLQTATTGAAISMFLVPRLEVRAVASRRPPAVVETASGPRTVARWHLTVARDTPTPLEIWVDAGRLLRLDLPEEGLSVVRTDIVESP